jgi:uncharacterized protein
MTVAGASGVVGRHLVSMALAEGWRVRVLTRGPTGPPGTEAHTWDPGAAARGQGAALDAVQRAIEGADLLVNLAGSSLDDGRLGAAHKARVLGSRLDATNALVAAHRASANAPPVWIQASAVGYYGDTGEAEATEAQGPGDDFLADVCRQWEAAAGEVNAGEERARLSLLRIGLVLARDAPAWQKMSLPIRLGVGGPLGSGDQFWSWIDADDLARAVLFLYDRPDARGAYTLTAPEPVRQADFTRRAAILCGSPAFLPAPAFVLRLVLGELADLLLLASCKAKPDRLLEAGFEFQLPAIDLALMALIDP